MEFVTVRALAAIIEAKRKEGVGIWSGGMSAHNMVYVNLDVAHRESGFEVTIEFYPGPSWNDPIVNYKIMDSGGGVLRVGSFEKLSKVLCKLFPVRGNSSEMLYANLKTDAVEVFKPRARAAYVERRYLVAEKSRQVGRIEGIDAQLGAMVGWEGGNAAQVARKAELVRARAVLIGDVDAIDARVAEIDAVVS